MRPWRAIATCGALSLPAIALGGCAALNGTGGSPTPAKRLASIRGVHDYGKDDPALRTAGQHVAGPLTWAQSPPVGGRHNPVWMNCMGDVYDAQVPSEHAVHSLEHGAVWVTYNPDKLSKAQVDTLARKVTGVDYMLMSPYPGLDQAVSVQAWGYQLKLDSVTDGRIDDFIKAARGTVAPEPGAACSGGITRTGTTPFDVSTEASTGTGG